MEWIIDETLIIPNREYVPIDSSHAIHCITRAIYRVESANRVWTVTGLVLHRNRWMFNEVNRWGRSDPAEIETIQPTDSSVWQFKSQEALGEEA